MSDRNKYIVIRNNKIPFSQIYADCGNTLCFPVGSEDNLNAVLVKMCNKITRLEYAVEKDPLFTSWLESNPLSNYIQEAPEDGTIYGRQNGGWVEVTATESDPIFTAWLATNPLSGFLTDAPNDGDTYGRNNGNWVQIVTNETDPVFTASDAYGITASDITNWDTAYGWGDHSLAGYLTSFTETDPVFSAWLLTSPLSGYVPTSRTINISGVTQDLSANRTWLFDYQQNTTPTGTGTSSIIVGAKWFHTDSGRIYEYVYDGDTYQWVSPTLPTATGATGAAGPNNIDTSTTTPINGVLKGNGSTVAQAVAGTDYQAPIGYTPENQANKENTTLDNSSTKYPTNNLVKTNLDNFSDDVDYVIMINQRILFNY